MSSKSHETTSFYYGSSLKINNCFYLKGPNKSIWNEMNFLWKLDSFLLGFEPETSLIVSRHANNWAAMTSWKQRMLRITQLILLNKKELKMFLLPNQFSLKRFFVFCIYSQIVRYTRHLFKIGDLQKKAIWNNSPLAIVKILWKICSIFSSFNTAWETV